MTYKDFIPQKLSFTLNNANCLKVAENDTADKKKENKS